MAIGQISLTGANGDGLQLAGRNVTAFGTGDFFTLTFDADSFKVELGKGGNAVFAQSAEGGLAKAVLKLLRASADDRYYNGLLSLSNLDPVALGTLSGTFSKTIGTNKGIISHDIYSLSGGVFQKNVDVKGNAQGDVEQALSTYRFIFASVTRVL